jgi:hypothetical protein
LFRPVAGGFPSVPGENIAGFLAIDVNNPAVVALDRHAKYILSAG